MNKFYEHALSLLFFSGWVKKKRETEESILKGCVANLQARQRNCSKANGHRNHSHPHNG